MAPEPNGVEQAVSRTLRDNLEKIQRTGEELHAAINDLVAACASTRPSNALPPMVRAQSSAASLSASLEVLSRFVTSALQPPLRLPFEPEGLRPLELPSPELPAGQPTPVPVHPIVGGQEVQPKPQASAAEPAHIEPAVAPEIQVPAFQRPAPAAPVSAVAAPSAPAAAPPAPEPPVAVEPVFVKDALPVSLEVPAPDAADTILDLELPLEVEQREAAPIFRLDALPPEEQELHRRAYRVAKVSMQDIKMLRPEEVRVGREKKDLCIRLRDDIEKAHKEYDRRFQSIQSHPVDYFYDWMVEILAGGDPQALGEYPYPSPVLRH